MPCIPNLGCILLSNFKQGRNWLSCWAWFLLWYFWVRHCWSRRRVWSFLWSCAKRAWFIWFSRWCDYSWGSMPKGRSCSPSPWILCSERRLCPRRIACASISRLSCIWTWTRCCCCPPTECIRKAAEFYQVWMIPCELCNRGWVLICSLTRWRIYMVGNLPHSAAHIDDWCSRSGWNSFID